MASIVRFFDLLFGRNSDPGHPTMRRDDETCNISCSLNHPAVINTINKLTKSPIDYVYLTALLNGRFEEEFLKSANKINIESKESNAINVSLLPYEIRNTIDFSEAEQAKTLEVLLSCATSKVYANSGEEKLLELTKGNYKKVSVHRIMKNASSTLSDSLRKFILGEKNLSACFKPFELKDNLQIHGQKGTNGIVECSWNPLAITTRSFNFTQSHYPLFYLNSFTNNVYTVISLRDPIERICSFYNHFRKKFQSEIDFIENCHPDFIAGQLYFCDQSNDLEKAKKNIKNISRVLIVEESNKWKDILSSDLKNDVYLVKAPKAKYISSQKQLLSKFTSLIGKNKEISSRINDEYKLYAYAKQLASI